MRIALLLVAAACSGSGSGIPPGSSPPANYELDCAAANTATAAEIHCVRTDTRSGDVVVIDYLKLPVSSGSTATGTAPAGRFTTACTATSMEKRADFYCIRMNTETGELLLVNLQKASVFPSR
jgi:hypothetical protein